MTSLRSPGAARRVVAALIVLLLPACGDDGAADDDAAVELRPMVALDFPTGMAARPGTDELYVTERTGQVRRLVQDGGDLRLDKEVALDLTGTVGHEIEIEGGLSDLVFSADGSHVYLSLTEDDPARAGGRRTVVEYTMAADGIDEASRRELIGFDVDGFVHVAGGLEIGPDGYLWVAIGDTAPFLDEKNTGQNPSDILASLLRIDPSTPNGDRPYSSPPDNPFADGSGAPEVWSYGLRNPWRFSFDQETGDLWIGDVGDDQWEEIDHVRADDADGPPGAGANFGWSLWEGNHRDDFRKQLPAPENHVPPTYEYPHEDGACAVIGGYVYRGEALPSLDGKYLFADLCGTAVRVLEHDGDDVKVADLVAAKDVVSFAQDLDGELYVLDTDGVSKLLPTSG